MDEFSVSKTLGTITEMKVKVFGEKKSEIIPLLTEAGFDVVETSAEWVVSYGGDGTYMRSEHTFPGIPKLLLNGSRICKLCSRLPNREVLKKISEGNYEIEKQIKLEVVAKGTKFIATNDIVVHNADPRHGIRYRVEVNGKILGEDIIGDGIVAATPLGSGGYYRSITDSLFEVGIGLAFNNSTEQSDHVVLKEDAEIHLTVTRGPATVFADNQAESIALEKGDEVVIRKSAEIARLVKVF